VTSPVAPHVVVSIDGAQIIDWPSFHDVFQREFGFPDFYGRNMNAWVDCMTSVDLPDDGMSTVHAPAGGVMVLSIENAKSFAARCPEQYAALVECTAFVNFRRIDLGQGPVLVLSFFG
jgi:Barstar (barnase inhibitor)